MENKNNQLEGFHVGSQTPIDDRLYYNSEADLIAEITSSYGMYRFFEGMPVWAKDTGKTYRWLESATGLLGSSLTYPSGISASGVSYSGRSFNLVEQSSSASTSLYNSNGVIGAATVAQITSTLEWQDSAGADFITWDAAGNTFTVHTGSSLILEDLSGSGEKLLAVSNTGQLVQAKEFKITLDFDSVVQAVYRAPENFKIVSITNPDALTVTLQVNGSAYTLGTDITEFTDTLTVDVSGVGLINLNCELV